MNPILEYRLTKYEKTAILSTRAQQLASRSETTLSTEEIQGLTRVYDIAKKELELNKLPLKVKRSYTNGISKVFALETLLQNNIEPSQINTSKSKK